MPSPFPGVDPYLENYEFLPEVHHRLITAIAIAIAPALRPKYRVAIEKRIYLSDAEDSDFLAIPDVTVFSKPSTPSQSPATATLLHSEPIIDCGRETARAVSSVFSVYIIPMQTDLI